MTVTASSGSPRVSPQLFDTLPLSSVRQAEQQDRFPERVELENLVNFFRSGQDRIEASQREPHQHPDCRRDRRIAVDDLPQHYAFLLKRRGVITQRERH